MHEVKQTKLRNKCLIEEVESIKGNVGSLIGTLFEYYIQQEIHSIDDSFVSQREKYDSDIICLRDRNLDFEIKTSSSKSNYVFGNRISPDSVNKVQGCFILAIKYDKKSLDLTQIRFGWCDNNNWIQQRGNGQQSRLPLHVLEVCSV